MTWIKVATAGELPPGATLEVVAGPRVVALANVDGQVYALDGICPHQGGPLGRGKLQGAILTCPWHGWQFDACTGQSCLSQSIKQPQYPVRIEGDSILVDVAHPQ